MEKETMTVEFSQEKLEALRFYLQDKGTTVEQELEDCMEDLYRKNVPAATRKFLDRNDAPEEHRQTQAVDEQVAGEVSAPKKERQPSQRKVKQQEQDIQPEQIEQTADEGMTQTM